jgi:hypothetical protein
VFPIAGLLVGVALASAAAAQTTVVGEARDQIVVTGSLEVPAGETVDAAVILNGPATIDGTVAGALVVVNGRTEISGHVAEDVVVINGSVLVRSGAQIDGSLYSREHATIEGGATVRGGIHGIATRLNLKGLRFAGRIVWWIGYSVSTLILGLIVLAFAPSLDRALVDATRDRLGAGLGFGAAIFFLVPIAAVLFLAVIVAIPLGLFVLLALGLIDTVGYVAGAHAVGRLLVNDPSSRFVAFLAGWGVVRVLGLIPVLGSLVWLATTILGLGLLTVSARRAPRIARPALVPPPPAPA